MFTTMHPASEESKDESNEILKVTHAHELALATIIAANKSNEILRVTHTHDLVLATIIAVDKSNEILRDHVRVMFVVAAGRNKS